MWNVLPVEIKMAKSISSFKEKLKSPIFQLNNIFNQDNIGTYKLFCPKCRSSNVYYCVFLLIFIQFSFLFFVFVFLFVLNLGCNWGSCLFYIGWVSGTKTLLGTCVLLFYVPCALHKIRK